MNVELKNKQMSFLSEKLGGKTVMVSGATGLVGSAVVRYLLDLNKALSSDIKIIGLYKDEEKCRKLYGNIKDCPFCPRFFSSDDAVSFDDKVDYIVHCAGISGGSKMHLKDPVRVFDIGINGTRSLLEYAVSYECKGFVYVSTYEIYGGVNEDALILENHPCQLDPMTLRNSYAEVKRLCESMCVAYSAKYGMHVYSGRLTSSFGTGVSYNDPRFFAEFARCVVNGQNIVMKSTGGTVRNYLDVDDAASGFLYMLVNGENCTAYNLTNRNNVFSVRDIAMRMIELDGNHVELVFDIADDIKSLGFRKEGVTVVDPTKLENIGWSPIYTFDETLQKLLDTMKMNKPEGV